MILFLFLSICLSPSLFRLHTSAYLSLGHSAVGSGSVAAEAGLGVLPDECAGRRGQGEWGGGKGAGPHLAAVAMRDFLPRLFPSSRRRRSPGGAFGLVFGRVVGGFGRAEEGPEVDGVRARWKRRRGWKQRRVCAPGAVSRPAATAAAAATTLTWWPPVSQRRGFWCAGPARACALCAPCRARCRGRERECRVSRVKCRCREVWCRALPELRAAPSLLRGERAM